ncbi:NAD(P)-dependent dehydrogenase (short-subunit alcohol dehydrogenase family) [Azospirillum agricola]|uniref:SDR family oxidoreductase n=1 Tax=Azospirillum agricola TaxID=1720247 RepID=UPI001AE116C4|nr:SDR family oxidoreductase [Azospirillum agricola]MBP2227478.1 NAD(P)-dependent dehydrogenase (short-subunit alcohol dehydrogenase family) [Azospirillum agricola]
MARQESRQPPQHQDSRPGHEGPMHPKPSETAPGYHGSGKLRDKVALITGGDSGIGRAVAVLYAREGARVGILYLCEDEDAEDTRRLVEAEGQPCTLLRGDAGREETCREAVARMIGEHGRLDILVNNAAEQHPQESIEDITAEQLERTFRTNVFAQFHLVKAALPHMTEGACIINTASVTAYKGSPKLLDYSATKGAIVAFTRSLSMALTERGIRVNAVAPGPIWTPLIPSTFTAEEVAEFGGNTPMKRAGQPDEVAPAYVFLASSDSSYMSGQVLHPNGGTVVNG